MVKDGSSILQSNIVACLAFSISSINSDHYIFKEGDKQWFITYMHGTHLNFLKVLYHLSPGGTSGKEPACQCRRCKRCGFMPSVGKIPWRRAWKPTPIFLPRESPWTEELGGLWSIGSQRVGQD